VVELSSLYFDIVKDILYCNAKDDLTRRGVQTVLYECLGALSRLIIPVMPHMAEDIWKHLPESQKFNFGNKSAPISIHLADWPEVQEEYQLSAEEAQRFESILSLRELVNSALEEARSEEKIGSALESQVLVQPLSDQWSFLESVPEEELEMLFLTSQVSLVRDADSRAVESHYDLYAQSEGTEDIRVFVARPVGKKCSRCWKYKDSVGQFEDHPGICIRCHQALHSA
jgi:isoleucyl-tRNA synthetase